MTDELSVPDVVCQHARMVAVTAHDGEDGHLLRVAAGLDHAADRAAAWLHHVLVDTGWTREALDASAGRLSPAAALLWRSVVADTALLTWWPGMSSADYVARVSMSPRARRVRVACVADQPLTPVQTAR